jgi:hypothetical protein
MQECRDTLLLAKQANEIGSGVDLDSIRGLTSFLSGAIRADVAESEETVIRDIIKGMQRCVSLSECVGDELPLEHFQRELGLAFVGKEFTKSGRFSGWGATDGNNRKLRLNDLKLKRTASQVAVAHLVAAIESDPDAKVRFVAEKNRRIKLDLERKLAEAETRKLAAIEAERESEAVRAQLASMEADEPVRS